MEILTIFSIAILIMSVVIHEVAHGYAALWQGDPTAKYEKRLTLNPIKHLDPFGSVILPILLAILPGNFMLGWAKPVPYNPYNFRNQRTGELITAIAGPISNIILAIVFGLLFKFGLSSGFSESTLDILFTTVVINVALAVFNMMPIPPLDGSKVLFFFIPDSHRHIRESLERNSLILLILFLFFGVEIVYFLVNLILGLFL